MNTRAWVALLASALLLAGGCKDDKKKKSAPKDCDQSAECRESGKCYPERRSCGYGIDIEIDNPPPGSPHEVVQRALIAASTEPYDRAFQAYSNLLHSSETTSPTAIREWETMRFPAMRRKYTCFVRGKGASGPRYELSEVREEGDFLKLLVSCSTTDIPTPCHLKRDPQADGAWRIVYGCLN